MTAELERFDDLLAARLDWLKKKIAALPDTTASYVPQLSYLKSISEGIEDLEYQRNKRPEALLDDRGSFHISLIDKVVRVSPELKKNWVFMNVHQDMLEFERERNIDNFILHELFHVGQKLTTERHGDIREAPAVLRMVDYYADANAILAALFLYTQGKKGFSASQWRELYSDIIKATIRQIFVFDFENKAEPKNCARLTRHLTWHLQFHRVKHFRKKAHFREVQILVEPGVGIRNCAKQKSLPKNWPEVEPSELAADKPHLWLAMPNAFGIPMIHRFPTTKKQKYIELFAGIFECNLTKSSPFFKELFETYPDLIGNGSSPVSMPPSGPVPIMYLRDLPNDAPDLLKHMARHVGAEGASKHFLTEARGKRRSEPRHRGATAGAALRGLKL